MPQTDDGFQGFRPLAHWPTWDAMTSPERRRALLSDVLVALLGAALAAGVPENGPLVTRCRWRARWRLGSGRRAGLRGRC